MPLIQILECNSTLGTCCNDYGLVIFLDTLRNIMNFIQIFAPIVLIIMSCVQLVQMIANPEDKKGMKSLMNKYIAAVLCFFIPVFMNVVLNMMPETFSVSACWKQAKVSAEVVRMQENRYISDDEQQMSPFLVNPDDYEKGNKRKKPTPAGVGRGSATGKSIVQYAKSFVGQRYVWGGTWNGELPYTGTDCSGFVQGVFKHHGINLTRTTYTQWADKASYTLVTDGEIKAGDLVMYDGHVGILTGNGTELVHAQSSRTGIVISSDYRTCSSHAILGIMRINGVN